MATMIHVVAAVIRRGDDAVLIAKRPAHVHQGGLWEFPGGKLEPGETPFQALARELAEELGIGLPVSPRNRPLIQVDHDYGDKRVFLDVWSVQDFTGTPQGQEGQAVTWVAPEQLPNYEFPAANLPIVQAARLPKSYLITGRFSSQADFEQRLRRALSQGVQLVQLRVPGADEAELEPLVRSALALCHNAGAKLLVNGDPDFAQRLGADGVHLSGSRLRQFHERPLPEGFWVAASCHDPEELALAQHLGVDFVVLSPVKETLSHPGQASIGWECFADWVRYTNVPVYALGGLDESDLEQAHLQGAQGIAAIRAWWPD